MELKEVKQMISLNQEFVLVRHLESLLRSNVFNDSITTGTTETTGTNVTTGATVTTETTGKARTTGTIGMNLQLGLMYVLINYL